MDGAIRERNGEPVYTPLEEEIEIPVTIEEEAHETPRICIGEAGCGERIADFREVDLGFSKEDRWKSIIPLTSRLFCIRCPKCRSLSVTGSPGKGLNPVLIYFLIQQQKKISTLNPFMRSGPAL